MCAVPAHIYYILIEQPFGCGYRKEVLSMAKKQTIQHLIHSELASKISFGKSKHEDKKNLAFGESNYRIYSYSTYETYLKEMTAYARWLKEEKGISKAADLSKTEQYAKEYLQYRMDKGNSVYTLKMERSALSMLYGKQIDFSLPMRDKTSITRSRNETTNDKHYSREGKYRDVFIMGVATGGRRKDLVNLKTNALREKDGQLYISFERSKGGRNRLSPVREEYVNEVREIFLKRQTEGKEKVFDKIPQKIDIHALRREYAKNLYKDILTNPALREEYLKQYPVRSEYKTQKDKDGIVYTKIIRTNTYKDRDSNIYDRNDLYVISQALGHNRIDTSITHYLK